MRIQSAAISLLLLTCSSANTVKPLIPYITSFEADYQVYSSYKGQLLESDKGHLMFRLPNQFAMQSHKSGLMMRSDGERLIYCNTQKKQCNHEKISDEKPLIIMQALTNLSEAWRDTHVIKVLPRFRPQVRLTEWHAKNKANPSPFVSVLATETDVRAVEMLYNQVPISLVFSKTKLNHYIGSNQFSTENPYT